MLLVTLQTQTPLKGTHSRKLPGRLLQGPPGSGKTLLTRCTPTILPGMTTGEMLEVSRFTQFIRL
jgi:hypothetical protein